MGKPRYSPSAGEVPLEIDSHTAVLQMNSANKDEHFMVVFGGYYKSKKSNVVFQYSFARNVWQRLTDQAEKPDEAPVPRTDHAAVMYNGSMYVFGGADEDNNKLNDLWQFGLDSRQWTRIDAPNAPLARSGHSVGVVGPKLYVFGGIAGMTQELNDLQTFDFESRKWASEHEELRTPDGTFYSNKN